MTGLTTARKKKAPRYVSQLNPGDEFETPDGGQYRLIYNVGDMRAYVQLLKTTHVIIGEAEFDRPGGKINISTGTEVARVLKEAR